MALFAPYAAQHAESNGAGDARPTALQIVKDQDLVGKLVGKVMLVTGCSSGIGVETARALHATGADVYITARDEKKGQKVADDIKSDGKPGKVELIKMELDSLDSIKAGAKDFLSKSSTLNILINNAGVMACPEGTTQDGFETQFGTNYVGHFLLFQLLKPALLASASPSFASRVISVSSSGHRTSGIRFDDFDMKKAGYSPWFAYGQSKTANIYLANEIDRRYGDKHLHALSLHPGGIATPLQRHLDDQWMKLMDSPEVIKHLKSTEQGAATTVWAALAKEWEGKGGKYLEDCQESPPVKEGGGMLDMGYAKYAYDPEAEKRLWKEGLKLIGMSDDQ